MFQELSLARESFAFFFFKDFILALEAFIEQYIWRTEEGKVCSKWPETGNRT